MRSLPLVYLLAASNLVAQAPLLTREALMADARVLVRTLEEAHPDPYTAFGGRIAFHRAFQEKLRALPAEGMTAQAFMDHWSPFMARLKDGHTGWRMPGRDLGPGLPLRFKVVGEDLVLVSAASGERLGSRLAGLEGLDLAALRRRVAELKGCENPSGELLALAEHLNSGVGLATLVPGHQAGAAFQVHLTTPTGGATRLDLHPGPMPTQAATRPSRVELPAGTSALGWRFLDPEGRTALLSIRNCRAYRENAVWCLDAGTAGPRELVQRWFREQEGRNPKDDAEILATFPSALDTFVALAQAMKAKGTQNLIVDLRDNSGGNSLLGHLLTYVLQGPEGARKLGGSRVITRLSPQLKEARGEAWFKKVQEADGVRLEMGDYTFYDARPMDPRSEAWKSTLLTVPAMKAELANPAWAAIHTPRRVFVLSGAVTFSSGFDTLLSLHRTGATLVGVPGSQAPNCFIDIGFVTLPASRLTAMVSMRAAQAFPEDPVKGRMLPCDLPLTYERFKALGFDPNAEVLMALEGH